MESFGLRPDDCVIADSTENVKALQYMKDHTRCLGNRYETALLWETPDVKLPNNYEMALRRHHWFVEKLKRAVNWRKYMRSSRGTWRKDS